MLVEAQRGSSGTALPIFKRGARCGWVVNATRRPFYPRGRDPVPTVREAGWARGPVWTNVEQRKSLCTGRGSKPEPSRTQRVAIPTTLSRPPQGYIVGQYSLKCSLNILQTQMKNINILIKSNTQSYQLKKQKFKKYRITNLLRSSSSWLRNGQSRQKMNPEVQPQNYSYIHEMFCQINVHAKRSYFRRLCIQSRKLRISFVMSVGMYELGSQWTDLSEMRYWRLLLKSVETIQILLKSDKNIDHFRRRRKYVLLLPATKIFHKITLFE